MQAAKEPSLRGAKRRAAPLVNLITGQHGPQRAKSHIFRAFPIIYYVSLSSFHGPRWDSILWGTLCITER